MKPGPTIGFAIDFLILGTHEIGRRVDTLSVGVRLSRDHSQR
jgi:hypothetical protein